MKVKRQLTIVKEFNQSLTTEGQTFKTLWFLCDEKGNKLEGRKFIGFVSKDEALGFAKGMSKVIEVQSLEVETVKEQPLLKTFRVNTGTAVHLGVSMKDENNNIKYYIRCGGNNGGRSQQKHEMQLKVTVENVTCKKCQKALIKGDF